MIQEIMFAPASPWEVPKEFPRLSDVQILGYDLETNDPGLNAGLGPSWPRRDEGFVAGYALATLDAAWYFPVRHETGTNLGPERVRRFIQDVVGDTDKTLVMHNAPYDLGWSKNEGLDVRAKVVCTQIAEGLINERRLKYSLEACCEYHEISGKQEALLNEAAAAYGLDPKADLWRLDPCYVGPYAEQDAQIALKLWAKQQKVLRADKLEDIMRLECALLPCLTEMRWRGIRVDLEENERVRKLVQKEVAALNKHCKEEFGLTVEVNSPKSLQAAFEKLDLPLTYTSEKNLTFDKVVLKRIDHPFAQLVLDIRRYKDFLSLVCVGMIDKHAHNGRIHCELHPTKREEGGTVTGRFSCSNPNLQQVPGRDPELGPLARGIFLPELCETWLCNDYSQQEYRLLVHFASLLKAPGVEDVVQVYREEPKTDFHQYVADLTGLERRLAKDCNFGIIYNMGPPKFAAMTGLDEEFCKKILRQYHGELPFARACSHLAGRLAAKRGWVKTLLGRRVRFELYEPVRSAERVLPRPYDAALKRWSGQQLMRAYTYRALNGIIQGSAADMTKKAMLDCWNAGHVPMLQVHDELNFSKPDLSSARDIQAIMRDTVELQVPMLVDAGAGRNWAEAKKNNLDDAA